jgi:hypothetical protein
VGMKDTFEFEQLGSGFNNDHEPGACFKKSNSEHIHNRNCFHPMVIADTENRDRQACAAAQLLNALPLSLKRFCGKGTLPSSLMQAKVTVFQVLTPPEMAVGEVHGLFRAMASLLKVPVSLIDFGAAKRGGKTNDTMNNELLAGMDIKRAVRSDKYDRWVPYNYFHHSGDGPDFCSLVEPDKSKRTQWHGKKFFLAGEEVILHCQPASRRGTRASLAEDYRNSETAHM